MWGREFKFLNKDLNEGIYTGDRYTEEKKEEIQVNKVRKRVTFADDILEKFKVNRKLTNIKDIGTQTENYVEKGDLAMRDIGIQVEGIAEIEKIKVDKTIGMTERDQKKIHENEKLIGNYEENKFWETDIISEKRVSIPARTEALVPAKLKRDIEGTDLVCEPLEQGIGFIYVANCLMKKSEKLWIRVVNISYEEITLEKRQKLAKAMSCEVLNEKEKRKGQLIGRINFEEKGWELSGFDFGHLGADTQRELKKLILEYQELFLDDNDKLTSTTKVKHGITLAPGTQPICKAPYGIPYYQREVLQKEIDRLLESGIIRPSFSPWSAPVVLITKKSSNGEEKIRMCIDYRGLNNVTKTEYYPLPNISDLIQNYQSGTRALFTVIDVAEAYHQIDMEEKDIPLTGFSTFQGHYEYTKMPFGLKNAPSTFQRFMNIMLSGLTGDICMVYLDDIIIFNSTGKEDHLNGIRKVFDRLKEANVKLKPKKCQFLLKKVKYLGHIITQNGVLPDPEKIESIHNFPIPKTVKGVRSFLGLINWYRRFIPNAAELITPLSNLTKKDVKFEITSEVLDAISKLKSVLTSDKILIFPDFSQPFIVATDASGLGVGAVLSQLRDGYERPIAFASRNFKKAELNYSTTEKELFGVIFGIQSFRCYLYGRKFTVISDHRPLRWLLTLKDPGSRLARWALTLADYDFSIIHRQGKLHGNADALSRMYCKDDNFIDMKYDEFEEYKRLHTIPEMKNFSIEKGNLFSVSENWALAHCESKDLAMGAGIALQFKQNFGSVGMLKQQNKNIGEVAELNLPERNIYYMVTKDRYYEKPSYRGIWNALRNLKVSCEKNEDRYLAMPMIGCGLDKLEWEKVSEMIKFIFYNSDIQVRIYTGSKVVSSIHVKENEHLEPEWDRELLRKAQENDSYCQGVRLNFNSGGEDIDGNFYLSKDSIIYKIEEDGDKLIVPRKFVRKVLRDFHDSPMAGHQGQQKTLSSLRKRFFWPNMRTEVINYCKSCETCNERKTSPHHKKAPLQHFTPTTKPWELTSMDIVGPFVTSLNGNRYLLTFQDYFTKYIEAIPLADQKADTIARAFVENIIVRHGTPEKLLTDKGANFTSSLFKEVCKILGIKKIQTSSYAPTTNGQIERMHRVLKDMLSHFISSDQRDWDKWIPFVVMAYRGNIHSSTGYSPFFLMHGREQVLPTDSFIVSDRVRYDYDDNYAAELTERLRRVYRKVYQTTEKVKTDRVKKFNENTVDPQFCVGELVYLKEIAIKQGISKKLTKPWVGPYRIVEILGPVTCRIRKCGGKDEQVVHVNRLKLYRVRNEFETDIEEPDVSEKVDTDGSDTESDEERTEIREFSPMMIPMWNRAQFENEEQEESEEIEDEEIPLRRSTRVRRPPDRWGWD